LPTDQPTFTVHLNSVCLFGYHGLHEEEKKVGNDFEVTISMRIKGPAEDKISINDTIDYAEVYDLVKEIFNQRQDLLETICINISSAIKNGFPQLRKISVQIKKLHPPIASFVGSVGVTYQKKYK
jgi:dihydroneopterin aldolase